MFQSIPVIIRFSSERVLVFIDLCVYNRGYENRMMAGIGRNM